MRKQEEMPKWNLNDLYNGIDDDNITQDIASLKQCIEDFTANYHNKIKKLNSEKFVAMIKQYEVIYDYMVKLGSFAFLYYTTNMLDQKAAAFQQNINDEMNVFSAQLVFVTLEINELSDQDIQNFISDPEVKKYASWIRDIRVNKPYLLSDKEERLLQETTGVVGSWKRLFDEKIATLQFPFKKTHLNCSQILDKMSSHNATERKEAGQSLGETLGDNVNMFALITNTLANNKNIIEKKRGFTNVMSSRNLDNLIEDEVVNSLITTVKKNYKNISHRYYKLKAKIFNKDKLDYWDRNAPLPDDNTKPIPWNNAVDIVLSAYKSFSPLMYDYGKMFFDNKWIDAPVGDGKRLGAFAHPCSTSVHPYIMLNYMGKIRDVMTLAHELGHGVHQYLAAEQGPFMSSTPLTLAETASVFGEQLTFRYIIEQESSKDKRLILIASKVEDMINTVVRQIAFCDFELKLHQKRQQGELGVAEINRIWLEVAKESLGDAIVLHDEYKYYWSYIPHFIHSPFYVYAYAFGDCLVNSLYQCYLDKKIDDFETKYFTMLKAGGTLRHYELLKPFGLDTKKSDFWQQGLNMIANFVDELEALA